MKVTNERWITMSFNDSRPSIHAKQIGKGRWTTAYADRDSRHVYLFVAVRPDGGTDYAKELIADIGGGNLHIPRVERFDEIDGTVGDRFRVYKSERYLPLTAKCGSAWTQFKQLRKIAEEEVRAANVRQAGQRVAPQGYEVMERIIERVRVAPKATTELVEALELLRDATMNYGSNWWFEFAKRNCAVDAYGSLILLDCVFDQDQIEP